MNEKSINLWHDGYHELAIAKLEQFIITGNHSLDIQMRGWLEQLAARIADKWGNKERSQDLQRQAFANNRNLIRPKVLPPYRPPDCLCPTSKSDSRTNRNLSAPARIFTIIRGVGVKLTPRCISKSL
ncbi:hypothetical protein ACFTAO_42715 [Paenibacillus rhizoplanae]